jgi:Na+/H+-dicarboxylate symporter
MEDVGIFYGHLVLIVAFWYILWLFGVFFTVLACCTKKNLANLGTKRRT